jgi:O-antigen/teichoic acid export membrane protein
MAGGSTGQAEPGVGGATSAEYGRLASFLAVGVGLTGLITYAYFLIASHVLGKTDYGQITVLWSAVFITISTLYRPIEQLLSRHISERRVTGQSISQPMRVASTIQLGLAIFFAVLALALRGPIQNDLLEGNETLYWVFFSSVLFYAASYFARGFLAGAQRFGLFVALILSNRASARSSPCSSRSASSAANRRSRSASPPPPPSAFWWSHSPSPVGQ